MPILKQRKHGDGYYVLAGLGGTGAVATWQITSDGVNLLRRRGYSLARPNFSNQLLHELRENGYIFTGGSGLRLIPPSFHISSEPRPAGSSAPPAALSLRLLEGEVGWALALHIAETPRPWIEAAGNLVDDLSGWTIRPEGSAPVPAMQFWPGRGGALIPVRPREGAYTATAEGHWPSAWGVPAWLAFSPTLEHKASLFDAEDGAQLAPGAQIIRGEQYLVLMRESVPGPQGRRPVPSLSPRRLGDIGGWQVWSIRVPNGDDPQAEAWCAAIGHHVAQTRFRLALVTPPQLYDVTGLPVVTVGKQIIFALTPIGQSAQADEEAHFFAATFARPGSYRVTLDDLSAASLALVAERDPKLRPADHVEPLTIELTYGGQHIALSALRDGAGPHEVHPISKGHVWVAKIRCVVPLDVTLAAAHTVERREHVTSEEAGELLVGWLRTAVRPRGPLQLTLDAGSYGRLLLRFARQASSNDGWCPTPKMAARARWLAAALGSPSQHVRETYLPLSADGRRALGRLAAIPGCEALRSTQAAPASLISHIYALARLVSEQG